MHLPEAVLRGLRVAARAAVDVAALRAPRLNFQLSGSGLCFFFWPSCRSCVQSPAGGSRHSAAPRAVVGSQRQQRAAGGAQRQGELVQREGCADHAGRRAGFAEGERRQLQQPVGGPGAQTARAPAPRPLLRARASPLRSPTNQPGPEPATARRSARPRFTTIGRRGLGVPRPACAPAFEPPRRARPSARHPERPGGFEQRRTAGLAGQVTDRVAGGLQQPASAAAIRRCGSNAQSSAPTRQPRSRCRRLPRHRAPAPRRTSAWWPCTMRQARRQAGEARQPQHQPASGNAPSAAGRRHPPRPRDRAGGLPESRRTPAAPSRSCAPQRQRARVRANRSAARWASARRLGETGKPWRPAARWRAGDRLAAGRPWPRSTAARRGARRRLETGARHRR